MLMPLNAAGLVPFWTKRNPDYGSMLKTINCRDDSLYDDRGMWTSMKKKKRCIVVAQGFYEWLKKNNGKDKIPHFTKRKDGQLMCFAGLYDCVQFDGTSDSRRQGLGRAWLVLLRSSAGNPYQCLPTIVCCAATAPATMTGVILRMNLAQEDLSGSTSDVPRSGRLENTALAFTDISLDSEPMLFTYTIITTDSNKQLKFLHDRYVDPTILP